MENQKVRMPLLTTVAIAVKYAILVKEVEGEFWTTIDEAMYAINRKA